MFGLSPSVAWALAGLLLIALEAVVPGLIIVFFGLGALATSLATALFGLSTDSQLLLFAASSVVSLLGLRRLFKKTFQGEARTENQLRQRLEDFTGEAAVVTEAIPEGGAGRIKLRGSFYAAVAREAIPAGTAVKVAADVHGDHSLFKVETL
ncbi:NfeD family protein [Fundidesulfovibrio agrisoli]|uniref:NfeD family protein n=1 Tax=Fundidesulfovibrio agrisoli TaxID=2922717 RepID=UPI001FADA2B9|nr:NfeD family protein [Fundidesulfovibrio agrisoli]